MTAEGHETVFAGKIGEKGDVNGKRLDARFFYPQGVALDKAGNLFVIEGGEHYHERKLVGGGYRIRKVSRGGQVTTLAGTTGNAEDIGSADGIGVAARFNRLEDIAVGSDGNVYVVDSGCHNVRKITPEGVVTTIAGKVGERGAADGKGESARFSYPRSLAIDQEGNIYVADTGNRLLRKITPDGTVTTVAGGSKSLYPKDGIGKGARFVYPTKVRIGKDGHIYVYDRARIRKCTFVPASDE